ncbi:MAG: carbohydrate ABC transporter substrate-binding protein [Clostridiales bacterium]|nr:carbohydrate ABC transporter substrate-binding protein [Clostridiales bacterium]
MEDDYLLSSSKKIRFRKSSSGRRIVSFKATAGLLAAAVFMSFPLSLSGCKKKTTDENRYQAGRVIKDSDPYFYTETNMIQIPFDAGKELEGIWIPHCVFTGEVAVAEYHISYKIPIELQKQTVYTEDGGEKLAYDPDEYSVHETALFDAQGKLIKKLDGSILISSMTQDREGNLYILERTDMFFGGGGINQPEGAEPSFQIEKLDASGNTIGITPVNSGSESFYFFEIHILDDGTFLLNEDSEIYMVDLDGKITGKISDGERRLEGDLVLQDGKYYVMSIKPEFGTEGLIQFKEVDLKTGELGPGINADILTAYDSIRTARDGVYVNTSSGCMRYDIVKGTLEEVFNWNDTDVDRSLLGNGIGGETEVIPKNENEFSVVGYSSKEIYGYVIPHLIRLKRAEKNPNAGKKMLVIGGEHIYEYPELLSFASRYSGNTESKARIVFVDYTEGLRPGEGLISLEQSIYLDSLTGKGPDILVNMFDSIAFRNDEIMVDLNQYLDGKNGIDRSGYFDNIFRACETSGNLYHIPLKFELSGLGVNAEKIPYSGGWTYEEFEEACRNTEEQISFLEATPCMDLLELFLNSSLSQFVDYKSKKVDFTNEDMKKILTMSRTYGKDEIPSDEGYGFFEIDYGIGKSAFASDEYDLSSLKFLEGRLLARKSTLCTVYDYSAFKGMSPGRIEFLGYPSKEKTGMIVHPTLTMGIVSSSTAKEQAWDFISAFLNEEPENVIPSEAFSVKRDTFEKESQTIMERRNDFFETIYWDDYKEAEYLDYRVSGEDIEEVRKLIENVTISSSGDPALFAIIQEETAAYFAGDRGLEDVLNTIQNRAATIVNEK